MTSEERKIYNKNYYKKNRAHLNKKALDRYHGRLNSPKSILVLSADTSKVISTKYYLDKEDLLYQTIISQGKGKPTDKLVRGWLLLIEKFGASWNFKTNDDKIDAEQNAFVDLWVRGYKLYNENKGDPFRYYTEIIKRSFWMSFNIWNYEKVNNMRHIENTSHKIPIDKIYYL